jgi:hypothetical protein
MLKRSCVSSKEMYLHTQLTKRGTSMRNMGRKRCDAEEKLCII